MGSGNAKRKKKENSVRMSLGRSEGTQWDVSASDCLSFHCRSLLLQAGAKAGCLLALEGFASVWFLLNKMFRQCRAG